MTAGLRSSLLWGDETGLRRFLERLIRDWLAVHRAEIEMFFLPACSPDLNPDQRVNAESPRPDQ